MDVALDFIFAVVASIAAILEFIFAAVASVAAITQIILFWIAIRELRAAKNHLAGSTIHVISEYIREVEMVFLQYPEYWPYVYEGKKLTPEKEEDKEFKGRLNTILGLFLDLWDGIYAQRKAMTSEQREQVLNFIKIARDQPLFEKYLSREYGDGKQFRDMYHPELVKIIQGELNEIKVN